MVSCALLLVSMVVTVKVAVLDPAGIVTLVGTKAGEPLVHSAITMPPVGAAALIVTVPVAEDSLTTLVGLTETEESDTEAAGVTVSAAVLLTLLYAAVIVTEVVAGTDNVVTGKVAVVLPAATVTEAGTVTEALLLVSETDRPPVGAALFNVTVPVEDT